jgi:hypothetical protein
MISLSKALKTGRIAEFIRQEEQRGIGPAERAELEAAIKRLATQPPPEDQTSHSTSDDGSTEK